MSVFRFLMFFGLSVATADDPNAATNVLEILPYASEGTGSMLLFSGAMARAPGLPLLVPGPCVEALEAAKAAEWSVQGRVDAQRACPAPTKAIPPALGAVAGLASRDVSLLLGLAQYLLSTTGPTSETRHFYALTEPKLIAAAVAMDRAGQTRWPASSQAVPTTSADMTQLDAPMVACLKAELDFPGTDPASLGRRTEWVIQTNERSQIVDSTPIRSDAVPVAACLREALPALQELPPSSLVLLTWVHP